MQPEVAQNCGPRDRPGAGRGSHEEKQTAADHVTGRQPAAPAARRTLTVRPLMVPTVPARMLHARERLVVPGRVVQVAIPREDAGALRPGVGGWGTAARRREGGRVGGRAGGRGGGAGRTVQLPRLLLTSEGGVKGWGAGAGDAPAEGVARDGGEGRGEAGLAGVVDGAVAAARVWGGGWGGRG